MANDFPTICSLNEWEVHLADEVRDHLTSQLKGLYDNDESAASRHLDRILGAMKTSPATTVCRVNQILATREQVEEGLRQEVMNWKLRSRGDEHDEVYLDEKLCVRKHPLFSDVVCVMANAASIASDKNGSLSLCDCSIPRPEGSASLFKKWPVRAQKGWPMTHRVVICDRFCAEAVLRGSDIFACGVLCADLGLQAGESVAVYADIRNASERPMSRGLLLEKYSGQCIFLGLGKARSNRAEWFESSKGVAVAMSSKPKDRVGPVLPPLSGVMAGKFIMQNLPSIVVAHALDPQPGEVILDMCSAPGGKTSHVASLVRNKAIIVACDKSRKKMVVARAMFRKMGATCITPLAWDSTSCVVRDGTIRKSVQQVLASASASSNDGLLNVAAFFPESFDKIILDPPCSALGLRPKLQVDTTTVSDLKKHVRYQRLFVKEAVALLKPNGIMTYSTCTIHALENEAMVRHILDEYPCMKLMPIDIEIGLPGLPGFRLTELERLFVRRFDPSDKADTMGFFAAKFQKVLS